jgi:monoamine oxidase
LLDGYGSLVDFLRRSIDPRRIKLQLDWPVSEIQWKKSAVEVRSLRSSQTMRAPCALITLPIGVLLIPREMPGAVRFTPDIASWRETAMHLASGPIVKVIFRFRESFWERNENLRDTAFMHNPAAAFPTWWTQRPLRVPLLTGWAGGPRAVALSGFSRQHLLEAAIDSLTSLVGLSSRRLHAMIERFHCYDWGNDPFSRGAYSYVTVGGMSARPKLIKPIIKTLFFAGEALDTTGQASTVAGALASGKRAARQILSNL